MKRRIQGVVSRANSDGTRRVEVVNVFRHNKYGKIVRRTLMCHAHDYSQTSGIGGVVELVESRPLSRLKRWVVVRTVRST